MQTQRYQPSIITGTMLDSFLARGWFRMGQSVFTTHYLRFQQKFYPAIWLRYGIAAHLLPPIQSKVKKIETKFSVHISPWLLDEEQEALFALYREHSGLAMSPYLREILLDGYKQNIFETLQVTVRHGDKLIGLGIFDLGEHAVAGISNIYHPDYKKFSLGKMLMLLKIKYSIQQGYSWFYPGYAVPGYKRFDYKLEYPFGNIQYYQPLSQSWLPFFPDAGLPNFIEQLEAALQGLMDRLRVENIPCRLVYYPAFDFALADDMLPEVVTTPVFLLVGYEELTETSTLIVYALEKEGFGIVNALPLYKNGWVFEGSKCVCLDVLQVVDGTDAIFDEGEILKIIGA
jgi:arginine-tRNA-protein transferase